MALVLSLLVFGWSLDKDTEAAVIFTYYRSHILLPLLLVIVIQLICNIYSIMAWTRTSLRWLYETLDYQYIAIFHFRYVYVDVFYVTVFSRAISMIFCVYMTVMIFKPHYFFDSSKMQVVSRF